MSNNTGTYKYLPPQVVDRLHGIHIGVRKPMRDGRQSQHRSNKFGASVALEGDQILVGLPKKDG